MNLAPIALFVYNRLPHTRQTVEALTKNELAADSELFVFSDGPRSDADSEKVAAVREYLQTITGFKAVTVVNREDNLGCARSITSGVGEIVNRFGQIIVVEDDIVTSPYFLRYMNDALALYRDEERVACIHGYLYPVAEQFPETFFIRGADIWGWGTWKRAWDRYEPDGRKLLNELKGRKLARDFNFDGTYDITRMLEEQIAGKIDTWDIQWCASTFLEEKLTLYPGKSLVQNIGYDCSGTHCRTSDQFDVTLSEAPVSVQRIALEDNLTARRAIGLFLNKCRSGLLDKLTTRAEALIKRILQ